MFGLNPLGAAASTVKPLVEFRAGKCLVNGKNVTPEKRKGTVQLFQSPGDLLMHFQWKDRTTGAIEDDLIVFPEEATIKKVKQSNGRVYLFEFKDSSRKLFIWMQEPSADKDDEYLEKINQYINNPPSPESSIPQTQPMFPTMRPPQSNPQPQPVRQAAPPQSLPTSSTQQPTPTPIHPPQQLPQLQQPTPTPTPTPVRLPPPVSSQPAGPSLGVQLSALQNILSGLPLMPQHRQITLASVLGHNLQHIITPEAILPLLNFPDVVQRLLTYLPEEKRTEQELRDMLRSPQLQQAIQTLSYAIESGQLNDVVRSLGLERFESVLISAQEAKEKEKEKEEKTH